MEYLFALLVLIWVLSQLFGNQSADEGSKAPPQPSERERDRSRTPSGEERSQSVQDAVREIEEQLRGGDPQKAEPEPPHHWEQRESTRESGSQSGKAQPATDRRTSSFETKTSEWHRSQVESPDVKDVTFENEISTPPSFEEPGFRPSRPSTSDEPDMQSRIRRRLASPEGVREAFLIKELIDRPRSQRPWPG